MGGSVTESTGIEKRGGVAIIRLAREFGSAEFDVLAELEELLEESIDGAPVDVLIDLGHTTYVGCAFLNVLLHFRERIKKMNGRHALCGVNSLPAEVFAITRLDSLWETFQTPWEGIEVMESRPVSVSQI